MIRMTFRSEGPGPPEHVRWKKLLKAALRGYGLRCVDLEEMGNNGENGETGCAAPALGEAVGAGALGEAEALGGR